MAIGGSPSLFWCLSATGFGLLWGVMSLNGGSEAMLNTAWKGTFPDGSRLQLNHSGIWPLDFQLNTLIAFFSSVSNLEDSDAGPYLMVLDLTTSILVINMIAIVVSRRALNPWLRSPTLWICLWNCFGTAIFFPLWSALCVKQPKGRPSRMPSSQAKALPATAIVGILIELPLIVPAWVGADPETIHRGILLYFLGLPAAVLFQNLASRALNPSKPKGWEPLKLLFGITGVLSSLVHAYTIIYALISSTTSLSRIYIPHHGAVQPGTPNLLTEAAHLFLQYDYIIITITALLVGLDTLHAKPARPHTPVTKTGSSLAFLSITAVFGPGAGLAYVAYCVEDGDLV